MDMHIILHIFKHYMNGNIQIPQLAFSFDIAFTLTAA